MFLHYTSPVCRNKEEGAGLGPAIAFLYSGPAINILAIVYTARLLGYDLGIARGIGAIIFSVVIGLLMSVIWARDERRFQDNGNFVASTGETEHSKPKYIGIIFFLSLLGILIFGAAQMWIYAGVSLAVLIAILIIGFKKGEIKDWLKETGKLAWQIVPILLSRSVLLLG
ncbi:MAG: permease [Actinomycetota bacterium]|nr:permease [Actinomycetota bacterium]